jgi:hypothetical protein
MQFLQFTVINSTYSRLYVNMHTHIQSICIVLSSRCFIINSIFFGQAAIPVNYTILHTCRSLLSGIRYPIQTSAAHGRIECVWNVRIYLNVLGLIRQTSSSSVMYCTSAAALSHSWIQYAYIIQTLHCRQDELWWHYNQYHIGMVYIQGIRCKVSGRCTLSSVERRTTLR